MPDTSRPAGHRAPAVAAASAVLILGAMALGGTGALADEAAMQLLKRTSDYVGRQQSIAVKFDSEIEIVTPSLQKLQFTSSGEALLNRPDKLRVHRTGGYSDVELVFDGKTFTIYGKDLNAFAQVDFSGTTDALVDKLRGDHLVDAPGSDLLLSNIFEELGPQVLDGQHIGQGVIDGVECEHLAFRNAEVDWQLWVEAGPNPIPRKYVITSKAVTGGPQYTLRIKAWNTGQPASPDAFAFKQPADAKRIDVKELSGLDEVPPGMPAGGVK